MVQPNPFTRRNGEVRKAAQLGYICSRDAISAPGSLWSRLTLGAPQLSAFQSTYSWINMNDNINLPPRGWEDRSDSACRGVALYITESIALKKRNKLITSTPTTEYLSFYCNSRDMRGH